MKKVRDLKNLTIQGKGVLETAWIEAPPKAGVARINRALEAAATALEVATFTLGNLRPET